MKKNWSIESVDRVDRAGGSTLYADQINLIASIIQRSTDTAHALIIGQAIGNRQVYDLRALHAYLSHAHSFHALAAFAVLTFE